MSTPPRAPNGPDAARTADDRTAPGPIDPGPTAGTAHAEPAGHRLLPHTADVRLEAWGPTREECLAQAVRALAEIAVDPTPAPPTTPMPVTLAPATDTECLVALLEEAIFAVDVLGVVPLDAHLAPSPDDGALTGHFDVAPLAALPTTGSAPKAITRHGLRFDRATSGDGADHHAPGPWRCLVTVDV